MGSSGNSSDNTKYCNWCHKTKPVDEFYKRKRGVSKGYPTQFCKDCNTPAARYNQYKQLAKKGTLDKLIQDLEDRLQLAKRVNREFKDSELRQKAMNIGLEVLRQRGEI